MTFDLEKAREAVHILENFAFASGRIADGQIQDILWGARLLAGASTEIERLRPFEIAARDLDSDLTKIAGERDDQAARIQDLEDALVEERARALWFEGDDPCDPPNLDWKTEPNDIPESVRLLWGESARQQLQAEGKIGPDADAKPQVWQITEERKAAIKELSELLTAIGCPSCHYYIQKNYGEDITVLRAMLTEAE